MRDVFHRPATVRKQSGMNKQGSGGVVDAIAAGEFLAWLDTIEKDAYRQYELAVGRGVAKEQARIILPTSVYTSWYWTIDLHNLLHFLGLRCDSHAQEEIRLYADAMLDLITPIVPETVRAWNDYHAMRGGMLLSRMEVEALRHALAAKTFTADGSMVVSQNKREQQEWVDKLIRLGANIVG
jgi:thymidylate synthase (FAD)